MRICGNIFRDNLGKVQIVYKIICSGSWSQVGVFIRKQFFIWDQFFKILEWGCYYLFFVVGLVLGDIFI